MPPAQPSPLAAQRLRAAVDQLRQGQPRPAADLLRAVVDEAPDWIDARRLLGVALFESGEFDSAEALLRAVLAADPNHRPALTPLSELLVASGRAEEARALLEPFAASAPDLNILTALGQALKACGRLPEAIAVYRQGAQLAPTSAVAEHNLAGALGDHEQFEASGEATARAFAKGLDAPQTWLIHARAHLGSGRLDEAEAAYRETLRRDPVQAEAHAELAQLIWMRTEDAMAAQQALDHAIAAHAGDPVLRLCKARLLEYVGDLAGAYAVLEAALRSFPDDAVLHAQAAQVGVYLDPQAALSHARRAYALRPSDDVVVSTLAQAQLAVGDAPAAAAAAAELHERQPLNQHAIALTALAWRLMGDPRYDELYDYQSVVRGWTIDTPDGWSSLGAYLADLATALERRHPFRTHPIGQSLRHGSQSNASLSRSEDPAIRAFFQAIDGPIRRHLAWLGHGGDLLRRRVGAGYRFNGVWSVRLRPNGFHADHVHPRGWLSSACYIALPKAVAHGHEGWIKFGEPGIPTLPALAPQHFVRPEPGLLVLFPSYMWHGTVPFSGDQLRLTVAFDLLPDGEEPAR
jgi:tetratricopeptide (TPR) repeat protein